MKPEITIIFVEDYKNMSKEEFGEYIKQIYQQGYNKGYEDKTHVLSSTLSQSQYRGNAILL